MNIKDLKFIFARIQFYKPLASKLHPAGAFSQVKTAFLRILNMYNYIVSRFVQDFFNLQVLGQQAASRRGFFPLENCIPGLFENA